MSRIRRAASAAGLLVAAGLAVWLATRLWRTGVPADLPHPPVNVGDAFGGRFVARAESYQRVARLLAVLGQVTLIATLAVYALRGARFARESAAGPIGTGFLLGMLGFAIVWLVQLPFLLIGVWWMRRHDVTDTSYVDAVVGALAQLASQFLFVCFALLIAMGLARLLHRRWWIPASAAFVGLVAAYAFLSPYLLLGLPNASRGLRAEAAQMADREGLHDHPRVQILEVREFTNQPNAFATGLGPSRRVVLFDTLADEFPRAEVRSVLAHEVGHLARDHIAKGIGWFAVVVLPTAFVVALVTRRRGGLGQPSAVPLALFVVVVLGVVSAPLQNAASRRYEAEADWTALQATRDPVAMEKLHRDFVRRALADPDPPGWWQLMYGSHPTGKQRVQMARAWEDGAR